MSLLDSHLRPHPRARRDVRRADAARLDDKTKPRGSLGRLEELACQIAAIRGSRRAPSRRARRSS